MKHQTEHIGFPFFIKTKVEVTLDVPLCILNLKKKSLIDDLNKDGHENTYWTIVSVSTLSFIHG